MIISILQTRKVRYSELTQPMSVRARTETKAILEPKSITDLLWEGIGEEGAW